MQHLNWDDLRIFATLRRSRSFNEAASRLGVNGTTVSRRVKALEQLLGTQLVTRPGTGGVELTDAGQEVANLAEGTEREVERLQARMSNADMEVKGRVFLTAVPVVVNRILIPLMPKLADRHPNLEIHLVPDNRNLSLVGREADIALRLARPTDGGHRIKARRIGTLEHAVYVSKECPDIDVPNCAWISYQEALQHLPQAGWMEKEIRLGNGGLSNIRVGELEGAVEAVAHGGGRTVLPCLIGDADVRLKRATSMHATPFFEREVWILVRAEMGHLAKVRAVLDWLDTVFAQ